MPYVLGFDGFRWNARVVPPSGEFPVFVLARFMEVGDGKLTSIDKPNDAGWQYKVTLMFAQHPGPIGGTRRAIELDYAMDRGMVRVRMRVHMAHYFMRQLGLDRSSRNVSPTRHQLFPVKDDIGAPKGQPSCVKTAATTSSN